MQVTVRQLLPEQPLFMLNRLLPPDVQYPSATAQFATVYTKMPPKATRKAATVHNHEDGRCFPCKNRSSAKVHNHAQRCCFPTSTKGKRRPRARPPSRNTVVSSQNTASFHNKQRNYLFAEHINRVACLQSIDPSRQVTMPPKHAKVDIHIRRHRSGSTKTL